MTDLGLGLVSLLLADVLRPHSCASLRDPHGWSGRCARLGGIARWSDAGFRKSLESSWAFVLFCRLLIHNRPEKGPLWRCDCKRKRSNGEMGGFEACTAMIRGCWQETDWMRLPLKVVKSRSLWLGEQEEMNKSITCSELLHQDGIGLTWNFQRPRFSHALAMCQMI